MKTILLLEDDESLNRGITLKLKKEGYQVYSAHGVTEAKTLFATHQVDLIISDITMDDGNGMEFCREIRRGSNVFIILLTALDQELDIVNGYDAGADDYVTKPFSLMVLISKVNAYMRRVDTVNVERICSGEVTVYLKEMKAYRKAEELQLSKKELQVLVYLMENARQIVSKEQLLEAVWDVDGQFVGENTVAVNISRLRNKLGEEAGTEEYIKNVRGIGYIWTAEVSKK